jgi:tetratricopeptide (TPR) repeat protein
LKDFKKAKSPLEAAVKYDGASIEARRDLGIVSAKLGDAKKANEQLVALKSMDTKCATSCSDSVKIADALKNLGSAIQIGKSAAAIDTPNVKLANVKSADTVYVSAVSLINEKRYDEAITQLNGALWATGPHPDVYTYLGFANRKLGKYDLAETYYQTALAIAPTHRGALEYYGELKLERGNVAGAKAHLAKLENICGFGCYEADELRRWIKEAASSAS